MDQSAKADAGKAKLSLVPTQIIYDIARVREYGNNKYGSSDNWKNVEPERYRDAAFRHLLAYLNDPSGVDEESGLPHLWHLACNIAFLCEMEQEQEKEKKECLSVPCPKCGRIAHVKPFGFDPLYPKGKPIICRFCLTEFYI